MLVDNIQEGVDKMMDAAYEYSKKAEVAVSKPGLSGAFISGGMVIGGAAVLFRGVRYLVSYVKAENGWRT